MKMSNIIIRNYTQNDFFRLSICLKELQDYEKSYDDDKVEGKLIDKEYVKLIHESCLKEGSKIFIAELEGIVVGFIHFELNSELSLKSKYIYISNFIVLDKFRNQGIGTLLLEECFKFAQENNFGNVQLEVLAKNSSSVSYYKNNGFETYALIMKKKI